MGRNLGLRRARSRPRVRRRDGYSVQPAALPARADGEPNVGHRRAAVPPAQRPHADLEQRARPQSQLLPLPVRQFHGFANASRAARLEVVPTLTSTRTDTRAAGADARCSRASAFDSELGVGRALGHYPDITADLALNPDFSQVEADVAQLEKTPNSRCSTPSRDRSSSKARSITAPARSRVHADHGRPRRRREAHRPQRLRTPRGVRRAGRRHEPAVPRTARVRRAGRSGGRTTPSSGATRGALGTPPRSARS